MRWLGVGFGAILFVLLLRNLVLILRLKRVEWNHLTELANGRVAAEEIQRAHRRIAKCFWLPRVMVSLDATVVELARATNFLGQGHLALDDLDELVGTEIDDDATVRDVVLLLVRASG